MFEIPVSNFGSLVKCDYFVCTGSVCASEPDWKGGVDGEMQFESDVKQSFAEGNEECFMNLVDCSLRKLEEMLLVGVLLIGEWPKLNS